MVSESRSQAGGAAVHHAGIDKGGDGIELLPLTMRQNSSTTAGSRAEERHATLDPITRIRWWDLVKKVVFKLLQMREGHSFPKQQYKEKK